MKVVPWITLPEPKYPLTESEKKWLEEREKTNENNGYYFCAHSELQSAAWNTERGWLDVPWVIDTKETYKDAAEFEARVAAKLTGLNAAELPCYPNFLCPYSAKHIGRGCKGCFLKHARLAVEAEMEEHNK
jgi:hypothetical protein